MSTVSLDWDEDRVELLGVPEAAAPFQPIRPTPSGLSSPSSSIATVEVSSFQLGSRERPQLEPPKRHYMLDLLELHEQVEGAVVKELRIFRTQTNLDLASIERLEKERDEALRRQAEDAASRNNWTVLGNVAQYLAAGTSIAVGLSLGPTGWGALLLASGVVGLGNRVVRDTVGWQTVASWFTKSVENQKRVAQRLEMGFLCVELGTGLFGGFGAAANGAFSALAADATRLGAARKLSATIQTASVGLKVSSQLGRTIADKRMTDLMARMRVLDAYAERIRMEMTREVGDARSFIDTAQAVGLELRKAIAASEVHDL